MKGIEQIFSRISAGKNEVSIKDAVKEILAPGGFGMLSLTANYAGEDIEETLSKVDTHERGNKDGCLSLDEFKEAIRYYLELLKPILQTGSAGGPTTTPPTWSELPESGKGWVEVEDIRARIVQEIEKESSIGAFAVNTAGMAKVVVALLDTDGDGKVDRAEYESLLKEIENVPTPWRP